MKYEQTASSPASHLSCDRTKDPNFNRTFPDAARDFSQISYILTPLNLPHMGEWRNGSAFDFEAGFPNRFD